MRWEYLKCEHWYLEKDMSSNDFLNLMGQDRWELVSVNQIRLYEVFYFKRMMPLDSDKINSPQVTNSVSPSATTKREE